MKGVVMKKKKYWYHYYEVYCPCCGRETIYKERRYTKKPKEYRTRHEYEERYDYCNS